jgi:hypothetical protein
LSRVVAVPKRATNPVAGPVYRPYIYNLLGTDMVAVKHDDLSLAFDFVS